MTLPRLCLLALLLAAPLSAFAQTGDFELVKLAEGVYAATRTEPPGLTVNGNSVFIINDEDVVVVDTTLTPGTAREELAALRRLTDKPVRYVVNTHWHDDHVMGNVAYRDAFPGAEFIAHVNTRGETLEKLLALKHTLIVPGHGPVLRDDSFVRQMSRLFVSMSRQVAAAAARGETLEQARRSVNLDEFRRAFAGDSRVRRQIFDVYVVGAGLAAAYADATAKP